MKTALAALAALLIAASAYGASAAETSKYKPTAHEQALMTREGDLNDQCRDSPLRYPNACDKRDAVDAQLAKHGWIWSFEGFPTACSDWHKAGEMPFRCTADQAADTLDVTGTLPGQVRK